MMKLPASIALALSAGIGMPDYRDISNYIDQSNEGSGRPSRRIPHRSVSQKKKRIRARQAGIHKSRRGTRLKG